jgi:hypothetical protein
MNQWFYLSFVDPELPEGTRFVGATIVGPANDMEAAIALALEIGCNPGWDVLGIPILPDIERFIPDSFRSRLLTRAEMGELDGWMVATLDEAAEEQLK